MALSRSKRIHHAGHFVISLKCMSTRQACANIRCHADRCSISLPEAKTWYLSMVSFVSSCRTYAHERIVGIFYQLDTVEILNSSLVLMLLIPWLINGSRKTFQKVTYQNTNNYFAHSSWYWVLQKMNQAHIFTDRATQTLTDRATYTLTDRATHTLTDRAKGFDQLDDNNFDL